MKQTFFSLGRTALFLILTLPFITAGCCNDDDEVTPPPPPTVNTVVYPDSLAGELKVQFMHTVDGQSLTFETQQYVNPAGDHYKVVDLRYYISNFKLKNSSTGKTFVLPDSYYLIRPKENKTGLTLRGIPVKQFDQVEFSIGLDPAANATSAHTGDLDPEIALDMIWDWKTGYKFFYFSGYHVTPNASQIINGLRYHIGENHNYKTLTFPLTQVLSFSKGNPNTIQVGVNLNELFRNPNPIDFDVVNDVEGGGNAEKLADNYANGMFTIQ